MAEVENREDGIYGIVAEVAAVAVWRWWEAIYRREAAGWDEGKEDASRW